MTRIDFYLLAERSSGDRWLLCCRLVEKVVAQGLGVYIHTPGPAEAQRVDQLLWSFRQQSFIPHGLVGEGIPGLCRVLIGWDEHPPEGHDEVLINLAPQVPPFFSRFDRVLEPLDGQPQVREEGRTRYRFYRDRGYPLHHHEDIKL